MSEPILRTDAGIPAGRAQGGPQRASHGSPPAARSAPDHGPPRPRYWLSLQSNAPIPAPWLLQDPAARLADGPDFRGRWNEDSLICGCPDCGAPLSIRRWLMSADCWQCGTSVVVSVDRPF